MADRAFVLLENDVKALKRALQTIKAGLPPLSEKVGPRRTKKGGGGTGSATISGMLGLVITDIPKASDFNFSAELESTPAFDWELEIGLKLNQGEEDTTVWQLDWKRTNTTLETYATSPYEEPFRKLRPVVVEEEGNHFVQGYVGINCSKTDIRASKAEPLVVTGYRYRLVQDNQGTPVEHEWFIITNVMDLRALPGLDTTKIQIPFSEADAKDFKLDAGPCDGQEEP